MSIENNVYEAPRVIGYTFHRHDKHNTTSVVYVCDDDKNVITDSGFENGNGNWNQPEFLQSGMVQWIDDKDAKFGKKSLKIESHNPVSQNNWAIFYVDVKPYTNYYFTAIVKGEEWSDNNKCDLTLGPVDPKTQKFIKTRGEWTSESARGFSFDGRWHFIRTGFYSGSETKIGIGFCGSSCVAYVNKLYLFEDADKKEYDFFDGRDAIGDRPVSFTPEKLVCDESQNLFKNHDLEGDDYSFWESGISFGMTVTLGEHDKDHGVSLHYQENTYGTNVPKQTYYIKWFNLKRNTNYTFSAEYCSTKAGDGWFGLLSGNKYLPKPVAKYSFNTYNDDWCRVGVTFNSGDYDRIGFTVCDCGGEGYIDNLYLFKAE